MKYLQTLVRTSAQAGSASCKRKLQAQAPMARKWSSPHHTYWHIGMIAGGPGFKGVPCVFISPQSSRLRADVIILYFILFYSLANKLTTEFASIVIPFLRVTEKKSNCVLQAVALFRWFPTPPCRPKISSPLTEHVSKMASCSLIPKNITISDQ